MGCTVYGEELSHDLQFGLLSAQFLSNIERTLIDPLPAYAKCLIISSILASMMDHLDQGRQVLKSRIIRHALCSIQIIVFDLLMSLFSLPSAALAQEGLVIGSDQRMSGVQV